VNLVRGTSIILFAIIVIVEVAIFPINGRAQQVLRGEFSLSREVRWEKSVLPMGDYIYFVEANRWPAVVRVEQKGGGFSGMFIPQSLLRPGSKGDTGIVLGAVGNDAYVMSLRLQSLGKEYYFSAPGEGSESEPEDASRGSEIAEHSARAPEYLKVLNPNHEKVSFEEVEKVYLRACEAVQREFNRPAPVRPQIVLRLGSENNVLRYPMGEIELKKWDEYRFADAVVDLALHDLVTPEVRVKLGNTAVREAGATVNVCDLKACVN
jgi:hypothetical protein